MPVKEYGEICAKNYVYLSQAAEAQKSPRFVTNQRLLEKQKILLKLYGNALCVGLQCRFHQAQDAEGFLVFHNLLGLALYHVAHI